MLPLMASVVMVSCNKDDDDNPTPTPPSNPATGKVLLFEGNSPEAEVDVKVYTDVAAFTGYNKVYVLLYEQGSKTLVKNANITFMPEMDMGSHKHSCPVENPTNSTPSDGLFEGAIVFVMPTSVMGDWYMDVMIENKVNGKNGSVHGTFTVVEPSERKMVSFLSPIDNGKIFVSLVEPMDPDVGENVFTVALHSKASMMDWPAVTNYTVEYLPWMPTMGHSSPFVNPTHTELGHYVGEVNYTMTGLWHVYVTVKDENGNILLDADDKDENFAFIMTL